MSAGDYTTARALRKINDLDVWRGNRFEPVLRDNPAAREARIQAHMARIRSDPRWQEDRYRRKATPGMVLEIRERYLEHWSTLKRQRKTAMQREIAREYRVSALIVYRILAGRYWRE